MEDVSSVTSEYINSKGRVLSRYEDINKFIYSTESFPNIFKF